MPTAEIVNELRAHDWMPVEVEEQRIRREARRGFQKHLLRYDSLESAPVEPASLLQARRPEDEGTDLWHVMNRVAENLERGGVSDWHRDQRNKLRSVRALRGIDSKVSLNKGLWGLAERVANGEPLTTVETVTA